MNARFVVQEHTTAAGVHWDLMLQQGEGLTTFRLSEPPQTVLCHAVRAVRIFDHALRFLSYEGPVQKGTGRVRIAERGTYRLTDQADDLIALELQGQCLQGGFTLSRVGDDTWEFSPAHRSGQG